MADRDVGVLHRAVGPHDPAHPRVSWRMIVWPRNDAGRFETSRRSSYRARTARALPCRPGKSGGAVRRHCMMRPPPGGTPPHRARTSAPQAERSTNSSSRGRIGRSTITAGAAAGAAAGRSRRAAAAAAAGAAPPPPLAAASALASRRDPGLVLLQAFQRRRAAGRNAGANLRIVASGKRCGSRRSVHWSASSRRRCGRWSCALRSRRSAAGRWCGLGLRRQQARPGSGFAFGAAEASTARTALWHPRTGSTCSWRDIAVPLRRPAVRWSNAPYNRSGRPT